MVIQIYTLSLQNKNPFKFEIRSSLAPFVSTKKYDKYTKNKKEK